MDLVTVDNRGHVLEFERLPGTDDRIPCRNVGPVAYIDLDTKVTKRLDLAGNGLTNLLSVGGP